MKHKFPLLLLLMLFTCIAYAQKTKAKNNFILKGSTTDRKTHTVWLTYTIGNQRLKRKAFVKKGSFSFTGFIPSPLYAEFYFNSKPLSNHDWGINEVFLTPGNMTIALTGDSTTNAVITGSAMQDDWFKIEKQKQYIKKAKYEINGKMNEISRVGNTPKNHAAVMKLGSKLDKYNRQEIEIDYKFITKNPSSYLSPYLTNYHFNGIQELPLDSATTFYNSFTDSVKNSVAGKALCKTISKHAVSARGGIAPAFARKDVGGKTLDLKSFRGKNYVLLYFWASFSLYKSNEATHLLNLYKKYHPGGLEIIGISLNDNNKDWNRAIQENGLEKWHNILTKYNDGLQDQYNVTGMPPTVLILIDKKGNVTGRYLGDHPAWETRGDCDGYIDMLDKKLIEVFGK